MYVSASCKHSRKLVQMIDRTGFAEAYSFVNVDTVRDIPAYVDRVPLLFDGTNVVTGVTLFDMFSGVGQTAGTPGTPEIRPLDSTSSCGLGSRLDGNGEEDDSVIASGASWLHKPPERIETPDSEPMPSRENDK